MSRETYDDETHSRMWKLNPVERFAALALTVVQMNSRDARGAVRGFAAIAELMTKVQNETTRGAIANDLRDTADRIENLKQFAKN
jgi:hypothetical protein